MSLWLETSFSLITELLSWTHLVERAGLLNLWVSQTSPVAGRATLRGWGSYLAEDSALEKGQLGALHLTFSAGGSTGQVKGPNASHPGNSV